MNEKNSITQAITKVKALQHKSRNPERSVGAPPTLQRQIPVPVYELSGRVGIPEPVFIPTSSDLEYHSIIPEDHSEAEPSDDLETLIYSSHPLLTLQSFRLIVWCPS